MAMVRDMAISATLANNAVRAACNSRLTIKGYICAKIALLIITLKLHRFWGAPTLNYDCMARSPEEALKAGDAACTLHYSEILLWSRIRLVGFCETCVSERP